MRYKHEQELISNYSNVLSVGVRHRNRTESKSFSVSPSPVQSRGTA